MNIDILFLTEVHSYTGIHVVQGLSLGCYNKVLSTTRYVNSRSLFLQVLEVGYPRSECWHGRVLMSVLFLAPEG